MRGFESVGPDRPTRRAERGEEILGRNDPTDRPSTARSTVIFESERPDRPTHFRQARLQRLGRSRSSPPPLTQSNNKRILAKIPHGWTPSPERSWRCVLCAPENGARSKSRNGNDARRGHPNAQHIATIQTCKLCRYEKNLRSVTNSHVGGVNLRGQFGRRRETALDVLLPEAPPACCHWQHNKSVPLRHAPLSPFSVPTARSTENFDGRNDPTDRPSTACSVTIY